MKLAKVAPQLPLRDIHEYAANLLMTSRITMNIMTTMMMMPTKVHMKDINCDNSSAVSEVKLCLSDNSSAICVPALKQKSTPCLCH